MRSSRKCRIRRVLLRVWLRNVSVQAQRSQRTVNRLTDSYNHGSGLRATVGSVVRQERHLVNENAVSFKSE